MGSNPISLIFIKRGNLHTDIDMHRGKIIGRHRKKTAMYKSKKEASGRSNPANTLLSGFCP